MVQTHPFDTGEVLIGPGHESEPAHGRVRKKGSDKIRMERRFLEDEHARRTCAAAQRLRSGEVVLQGVSAKKKKRHQDSLDEEREILSTAKRRAERPVNTASTVMPVRAFHTDIMMPRLSGPRTCPMRMATL